MSDGYSDIRNYIFDKEIGEGNFGKVKLCIYKPTNEEFAIKILNKEMIKKKMKNSIFKENEIITRFNHINVIYVFQILEDDDNFYIIMEYCKYGELFDYIVNHERLSEEESSIFFYQLINGVEYIHSKGIAHRDLKPENLLLAENNILKIIDFGLSHEFRGDQLGELLSTKCGSPSYAAPEIISCQSYDGFKVDVWCCGIILYAMVCGYLPFEGENNDILFKNILECQPELPEFMSDVTKDIILRILEPDPDERISIKEIKNHRFYLMGKKSCKIDFDDIEENVIKKRKNMFQNANSKKAMEMNKIKKRICKIREIQKIETNDSLKVFEKKIIETMNNKIKHLFKYDLTENNNIVIPLRPFSSPKQEINQKKKTAIATPTNKKTEKKTSLNYINLLSEDKNIKKFKKDSLLIKILDSTKNNPITLINEYKKLNSIKYNTCRNSEKLFNQPKNSKSKSRESLSLKKRENHRISTTNERLITNTNKSNKKSQGYNLFKNAIKNKYKGINRVKVKQALSKLAKKETSNKNPNIKVIKPLESINQGTLMKEFKNTNFNLILPNSTLYYNNINININELNIHPKTAKNKKPQNFASYLSNRRIINIPKNKINNEVKNNIKKEKENKNYKKKYIYYNNSQKNKIQRKIYTMNNLSNLNNMEKKKMNKKIVTTTEPKENNRIPKALSFNNKIKYVLFKKVKKSKTPSKSKTITNERRNDIGNYEEILNTKKKNNKNCSNNYKYDINKIDELFLYKFMEHKYHMKKSLKK